MADNDFDTKKGFPWLWAILLGGLAIVAAIFLFRAADPKDMDVADERLDGADAAEISAAPRETPRVVVTGDALTDLAVIANTSDGSLEGRSVELAGVTAGEVPTDAGFWALSDDDRVWVVLDEVRTPDTPIEGRVDVDKGDVINISGIIRNAKDGAPSGAALPGPTASLPKDIHHFIYASKVVQSGS